MPRPLHVDESRRRRRLNDRPPGPAGRYVLYWMQASQRTRFNHALGYAVRRGNAMGLPVVVCFGLTDGYPEANARHYAFMLEGLRDVGAALGERGIAFVMKRGDPAAVALGYARDAAVVVCDRGYLRHQKAWRDAVADGAGCEVVEVETDVVVPVEEASDKAEYAARTIRGRIGRKVAEYLRPVPSVRPERDSNRLGIKSPLNWADPELVLSKLDVDRSVSPVARFAGGQDEGRRRLRGFVRKGLAGYDAGRNEPAADATSHLSPYLHFGQVSPVEISLAVRSSGAAKADVEAYLEELIVRRELAVNYVHYSQRYDRYEGLPEWARKTLSEHRNDPRPYTYTRAQLERAETHDRWWNAAQAEMVRTGFMHNYMRMYWGKKVIEWTPRPEEAFATVLYLNNKYFLDGRDPVSYANVGWLFGLHDRPWGPARAVFGTVRYMNAAGLERKFDMDAYAAAVGRMG